MYPDNYWSWHGWIFPLFMPIFWMLIIALCLYYLFSRNRAKRPWVSGRGFEDETALDILKKRYAKGEITKEEFEEMKRNIMG